MENLGKEFHKYATQHKGISSLAMHEFYGSLTPYILEERQLNVTQMDIFSRLIMERIIFIGTDINQHMSNIVQAQMLFLSSVDNKRDIQIYLSSPGGSVSSGLAIVDTMQFVQPDISIVCTSMAASMGAVILACGTKGKRQALKHARVMIHQPSGGFEGTSVDMEINMKEMLKFRKQLYQILSDNTKQKFDKISKDCDRDYWMNAEEAKAYGIIDEIILGTQK